MINQRKNSYLDLNKKDLLINIKNLIFKNNYFLKLFIYLLII